MSVERAEEQGERRTLFLSEGIYLEGILQFGFAL